MDMRQVYGVYISPCGSTKQIVRQIAEAAGNAWGCPAAEIDLTRPESRKKHYAFREGDLVILGTPVYAGRVPNKLLPELREAIHGDGRAVLTAVSVFGNRDYGEALRELILLGEENGFVAVAAAAVVSRHVFSHTLAAGRPDADDREKLQAFGMRVAEIAASCPAAELPVLPIDRETPIGPYYTPLKTDGTPAKFLKAKPLTDEGRCNQCGICAAACPMGSINREDCREVTGICIKCQACVRRCPSQAKYFMDEDFLSHVSMLEETYGERKEPVFLVGRNAVLEAR